MPSPPAIDGPAPAGGAGRGRGGGARRSPRSATGASWPTACGRSATSTSGASAPRTTSSTSTSLKDPKERSSARGSSPERERGCARGVEAAFVTEPVPLRGAGRGPGAYALRFATSGYSISPRGRGWARARATRSGPEGSQPAWRTAPAAGRSPRDRASTLRPRGAPVTWRGPGTGGRCGRADVALGRGRLRTPPRPLHPARAGGGRRNGSAAPTSSPAAAARSAVSVWLVLDPGRDMMAMDKETCERMQALGYVGSCAGLSARRLRPRRHPGGFAARPRGGRERRYLPAGARRRRRSPSPWSVPSWATGPRCSSPGASHAAGSALRWRRCCPSTSRPTARRCSDDHRLYPGVLEALDTLRDRTLCVLTNKPGDLSRALLAGLGGPTASPASGAPATCPVTSPTLPGCCACSASSGPGRQEAVMVGRLRGGRGDGPGRRCSHRGGDLRLRPAGAGGREPDVVLDDLREPSPLLERDRRRRSRRLARSA